MATKSSPNVLVPSENLGPTSASLSFRPFPERSHRPQVLEITIPARPAPSEGLRLTPSIQGGPETDKNGPLDWYLQAAGTLRERKTCHYHPKDPASNSGRSKPLGTGNK